MSTKPAKMFHRHVALKPGLHESPELQRRIFDSVVAIMSRVLAAKSGGQDTGDASTLANPEVVDELRQMVDV